MTKDEKTSGSKRGQSKLLSRTKPKSKRHIWKQDMDMEVGHLPSRSRKNWPDDYRV